MYRRGKKRFVRECLKRVTDTAKSLEIDDASGETPNPLMRDTSFKYLQILAMTIK